MAVPSITVSVPAGVGTYQIWRGTGDLSGYAELHFYPTAGSEVEHNLRSTIDVTYNNGRSPDHWENLDSWNGFSWQLEDQDICNLANYYSCGTASYIASYRVNVQIFGGPSKFSYQLHDEGMGTITWLYRYATYSWENVLDEGSQTYSWQKGDLTDRYMEAKLSGNGYYVPGQRTGEKAEYGGSTYGGWISALWTDSSINPDTYINGPTYKSKDATFQDGYQDRSTYEYDYSKYHNMVHLYLWRPWILVSCDYEYNASYDKPQDYDLVHYPGANPPTCNPSLLSCFLDLSTYGQGGSLPTPSWPGHELSILSSTCWFKSPSLTSNRNLPIYSNTTLTSFYSDHKIYCGWKNSSCEVDVYCYAPSQSKYIDFSSGDSPRHDPDPATGASVYSYGSYKELILSGRVGEDGWHYKYLTENGRRQYYYVYGSTSTGQYKYLSSGTDNGSTFHSGPSPYDDQEYWFYTNGGDHTIVFNYKKNGDFTYLPMYYPSNGMLIRGVNVKQLIRDGDA